MASFCASVVVGLYRAMGNWG